MVAGPAVIHVLRQKSIMPFRQKAHKLITLKMLKFLIERIPGQSGRKPSWSCPPPPQLPLRIVVRKGAPFKRLFPLWFFGGKKYCQFEFSDYSSKSDNKFRKSEKNHFILKDYLKHTEHQK